MDATHPIPDLGGQEPMAPDWLRWIAAVGWRVLVTLALAGVLLALAVILSTTTVSVIVSILVAAAFSPYVQGLRSRGSVRSESSSARSS